MGIESRNPKVFEAAKLCRAGKTQAEAAQIIGVHPRVVCDWFEQYDIYKALAGRVCAYCGKALDGLPMLSRRKYCSAKCGDRAKYERAHPESERKRAKSNPTLRMEALELYWDGLDGASIARHLNVSHGTVDCWVNRFGAMRERRFNPEIIALRPLKVRIAHAASGDEWMRLLREFPHCPHTDEPPAIRVVCGDINGNWESGSLAAVIMDRLRIDPCNGETFAFRDKDHDMVSTLRWANGAFRFTKIAKRSGSYLWPREEVGESVLMTESEFEFLLSYQKIRMRSSARRSEKP